MGVELVPRASLPRLMRPPAEESNDPTRSSYDDDDYWFRRCEGFAAVPERGRRIARTRFARLSPMASEALGAPALMF